MLSFTPLLSLLLFLFLGSLHGDIYLRDNLQKTKSGDYIVAAQGKMVSLLRVAENNQQKLTLEEISAPGSINPSSWREWAMRGAPGHCSWVLYEIDLASGNMLSAYSYTRRTHFQIPEAENFLGTLLTLRLAPIPKRDRKLTGPQPTGGPDFRKIWNPKLMFEGAYVPNIPFSAWKTRWPKDGSELSDRAIVIYLPEDERYPTYFPHWLEISGFIGKAKVRIIDSGENLFFPSHTYQQLAR